MNKHRSGFTLVELVVVVMILGILAAVAAPRLLETSTNATENGAKQTLVVIRDAIERFAAENGALLPGTGAAGNPADDEGFKLDLKPYLRGAFPKCPVGTGGDSVQVSAAPLIDDSTGWNFSTSTGEFLINSDAFDSAGVVKFSEY